MGKHRERHAEEAKKTHSVFKEGDIADMQETSGVQGPEIEQSQPLREHSENTKNHPKNELKEYITEIPFPISEKTGIMRQFLSGIERLFTIVRSSLRKAVLWISGRRGPSDEEAV
ncbi:hypothetical protein [Encephalitozoon cuniculi GB-M1]|uniref:Uncharacterized protein n=2 Tax=Encephalitozoon cuniculi TaxID=6035 RepID=Q8SUX8_ENCCU|nr:uncharacterized protein ECU07_1210 [Encephalitozoon cuniculi GB-M1]AGE95900.1 hypothetical protein ECU07_1210 [Encephalitozoon cuniculi]KMV65846.1 hypothetical protein M970_071180 [Encephalitozoon cuniculi EcunIII-L]UYI27285.1 hypothetical protein J0A71_05g11440 [Encephalitozoon cuniculi]CAD25654.1 hypothetical protein [Encephalitozoon cuniculi GB-M1]